MPQTIYTVEIDGTQYDIEGDRPPSEAEARAAVGAAGNFSGNQGTSKPQTMKDVVNQEMSQQQTTKPGEGGDFLSGLIGGSGVVGPTVGELWQQGPSALEPLLSGENLGGIARDVGMMGVGAGAGKILQGVGRGSQALGRATDGGPGGLAMRSIAGHSMGGVPGAVAAAAAPPLLKGFGRIMERTGNALEASPTAAQTAGAMRQTVKPGGYQEGPANVATPRQAPNSSNVVEGEILGTSQLPRPPQQQSLGPAQSIQQPAGPPQRLALPAIDDIQQQAMIRALEGPTPLGMSSAAEMTGGAPLGSLSAGSTPRVKSWKPGYGPSAGDATTMREAYGSKTAAQLLKTRQDQVQSLTPDSTPAVLPHQVAQQITQAFTQIPLEMRAQYIARANNPLVKQLLESLSTAP